MVRPATINKSVYQSTIHHILDKHTLQLFPINTSLNGSRCNYYSLLDSLFIFI